MVVGDDVCISELFHPLCVRSYAAGVAADLGLGKKRRRSAWWASVLELDDDLKVYETPV